MLRCGALREWGQDGPEWNFGELFKSCFHTPM